MATSIGKLVVSLTAVTKPFSRSLGGAVGSVKGFGSRIASVGAGVAGFALKLGAAGAAIAGVGSAAMGLSKGFRLAADFEQATVAMTTMLGSADVAKAVLQQLTDFAASTPFEFPELQGAAQKLIAFGTGAGDVVPELRRIGDISAGIGAPISEIAEIYGKARVQGRLFAEDINQLTGRGIPIIGQLADQFGVAESEVKKLVESGSVNFGHLQQAFADMTSEGGQFAGLMEAQSKTLSGLFSTLKDNVGLALRDIAQAIIAGFNIKGGISGLIGGIETVRNAIVPLVTNVITFVANGFRMLHAWLSPIVVGVAGVVTGAFKAIYDFLAPIVLAIAGFVGSAFGFIVEAVSTGFSAIIGWIAPVGEAFGGFGNIVTFIKDAFVTGFLTMQFFFENWKTFIEAGFLTVAAGVVTMANTIGHFFTEVIPSFLTWLRDNWKDILADMVNLALTRFKNLASNIVNIIKNIPGLIKGTVSFSDLWTPLSEGFEATLSELPKIPERQRGPLEQALRQQSADLRASLGTGLDEFLAERMTDIGDTKAMLEDTVSSMFSFETPEIPAPEIPNLEMSQEASETITNFSKGGEFKQVDLSRIAGGLDQGRNKPMPIKGDQRQTSLLERIAENTASNTAVLG